MIYIIDHQDSFTWNVVHQFAKFDKVFCSNYYELNNKLLDNSDVIVLSPGPGSPKDYPTTSKIYKKYKGRKKIIGITCHNSKKLIRHAIKDGANYIAIGAFFKSRTKKVNYIAKPSLISWVKRFTKIPVVIIGGITNKNFRKLLLHKPDFLAISGGIWDKKPAKAIKEFL